MTCKMCGIVLDEWTADDAFSWWRGRSWPTDRPDKPTGIVVHGRNDAERASLSKLAGSMEGMEASGSYVYRCGKDCKRADAIVLTKAELSELISDELVQWKKSAGFFDEIPRTGLRPVQV